LGSLGTQRVGQSVGDGQDLLTIAEAHAQRVNAGKVVRTAGILSGNGELVPKRAEGPGVGASPPIDRLARIADRRDRMAVTEQSTQQYELRMTGVLVLVE